jgi:hypothetical protein
MCLILTAPAPAAANGKAGRKRGWVAKVTCRVLDHQMFFAQLSVSVTQGWDTLAWPAKLRSRRFWFYDLARFDCDLNVKALEQLEHAAEYRIGVSSALGF